MLTVKTLTTTRRRSTRPLSRPCGRAPRSRPSRSSSSDPRGCSAVWQPPGRARGPGQDQALPVAPAAGGRAAPHRGQGIRPRGRGPLRPSDRRRGQEPARRLASRGGRGRRLAVGLIRLKLSLPYSEAVALLSVGTKRRTTTPVAPIPAARHRAPAAQRAHGRPRLPKGCSSSRPAVTAGAARPSAAPPSGTRRASLRPADVHRLSLSTDHRTRPQGGSACSRCGPAGLRRSARRPYCSLRSRHHHPPIARSGQGERGGRRHLREVAALGTSDNRGYRTWPKVTAVALLSRAAAR